MEKGNGFPLHFKVHVYLNSLEYESQYMYFFLSNITVKYAIHRYCDKLKHKHKFSKHDDLRGSKLSGLSEQS